MTNQTLTLHILVGCPFSVRCMIAAKFCDIDVKFVIYSHMKQLKTKEYLFLNPNATAPTLVTDNGVLTESEPIARYFGYLNDSSNINGATNFDKAKVDMIMQKINLDRPQFQWFNFMAVGASNYTKEKFEEMTISIYTVLNYYDKLLAQNQYLIGNYITLADIDLLALLYGPRRIWIPKDIVSKFENVLRWFNNLTHQKFFADIFGNVHDPIRQFPLLNPIACKQYFDDWMSQTYMGRCQKFQDLKTKIEGLKKEQAEQNAQLDI